MLSSKFIHPVKKYKTTVHGMSERYYEINDSTTNTAANLSCTHTQYKYTQQTWTLRRLRDCDGIFPASVSDRLVSDDDDGTLRGDEVPLPALPDDSRDLRFLHESPRFLHKPSPVESRSALCFNLLNDTDNVANFFFPKSLWTCRWALPLNSLFSAVVSMDSSFLSLSLSGDSPDFLPRRPFSFLPQTDFDVKSGMTGFKHLRMLHTHTNTNSVNNRFSAVYPFCYIIHEKYINNLVLGNNKQLNAKI